MKKRKILYLFPLAALVLSGCTIQEGWETAKGFMTDKVYEPVKNWIESLLGKKSDKQDQPADEPSDGGEQGGGGGGGQTETPKHAGTLADPFDAADALLVAGKLADKATSDSAYYIKDKVTDTPEFSASYGNFTFNFGEFKCFRILNGESKAKFTDEKAIEQGDTVLLNAKLTNYNGTLETAENTGYAVSITKADHGNIKRIVSAKGPKEVGLNEVIALTEVEVIIEYDDGFMTTVNPSSLDQDTSVPGAVTITVHVEGFSGTATFTVTVLDGQLPNQIEEAYAAASELDNYKETDQEYLIRGTVVAKRGSQDYFVQEGEYGIDLYNPGEVEGLEIGKEVQFKCRIKNYNGTFENSTTPTVKVLGEGTMPSELVISTAAEFAAANKNILARASGTAKDAPVVDNYGGYTLTLVSNQDELTVYAKSGQASKISSIKKDDEVILSKLVTGAYKTDLQLLVCDNTIVSPKVTAVNVQESMNIELGQQKPLTATVSPEEACQDVTWEISQTSEVINYVDGFVIPVSEGDAVITFASVIAPEITASCEVHVSEATKILTGITLGGELDKKTYNEGEAYSAAGLTVTAHYENAEDEDVTADSVITPEKETAEATDESITFTASYSGQEDTLACDVTVIAKPTPQHEGTEQDPYTVSDAKLIYDELDPSGNSTEVYVTGTIVSSPAPSISGGRGRFYITDGVCAVDLYVYNANNIGGSANLVEAEIPYGSTVKVKGAIQKYVKGNDYVFEFCYIQNVAACELVTITRPELSSIAITGTPAKQEFEENEPYTHGGLSVIATFANGATGDCTAKAEWSSDKATATIGDTEVSFTATYGGKTSPEFPVSVTVIQAAAWNNATMAKGSTNSYDDVTINGNSAIKIGKSSAGGNMTITVGAGATKLKFYAVAWNNKGGSNYPVTITGATGVTVSPGSFNPVANSVVSGTAKAFTLTDVDAYLVEVTLSGITAETALTLTSTERVIVWSASYK